MRSLWGSDDVTSFAKRMHSVTIVTSVTFTHSRIHTHYPGKRINDGVTVRWYGPKPPWGWGNHYQQKNDLCIWQNILEFGWGRKRVSNRLVAEREFHGCKLRVVSKNTISFCAKKNGYGKSGEDTLLIIRHPRHHVIDSERLGLLFIVLRKRPKCVEFANIHARYTIGIWAMRRRWVIE